MGAKVSGLVGALRERGRFPGREDPEPAPARVPKPPPGARNTDVRPNLFLVGAMKSGTTTLHDCLGRHPEIFMSDPKEPNYFADDLGLPYRVRDMEEYLALFAGSGGYKLRGESSTAYLASERAARRIREFAPDARILISLRDPIAAVVSLHAEARRWGREPRGDVHEVLAEFARIGLQDRSAQSSTEPMAGYRLGAFRADQVERYLSTFPRERVRIVLFEEWTRPDEGLLPILDFLDVSSATVPTLSHQRPSVRIRNQQLQRLLMTPPGWIRAWGGDTKWGRRLRGRLMSVNLTSLSAKPVLAPDLRRQLIELLLPDVERLSALAGRDLATVWWSEPASA